MLVDIRDQVIQSRLSHLPTNFCFLYNGHALDPNVEGTMKAADVAVSYESQFIVLIDNVHCNIGPEPSNWLPATPSRGTSLLVVYLYPAAMLAGLAGAVALATFLICLAFRPKESAAASYEQVPFNLDHDKESDTSEGLHPVKMVPCLPRLRGVLGGKPTGKTAV